MVEEFKIELLDNPPSLMCSKWVLDRIPFVFSEDRIKFLKWKEELAQRLGIDPKSLVLTGSASCGFSLNPHKGYKEYSAESDIDIAIISELHFDIAWKTLRDLGTRRFDLTPRQSSSLKEHVDRLVYWGTIATDKLLVLFPFGLEWTKQLLEMSKKDPAINRTINVRLYKDYDALRAYQVANLQKLRLKLYETV